MHIRQIGILIPILLLSHCIPGPVFHAQDEPIETIPVLETAPGGWIRHWGATDHNWATAMDVDGEGNAYIVGTFSGLADLNPGPDVTSARSLGDNDCYLMKLNPAGDLEWFVIWGGRNPGLSNLDTVVDVQVDFQRDIYVTGVIKNSVVDLDPGLPVAEFDCTLEDGAYLSKFDPNGTFLWGHCWHGWDGWQSYNAQSKKLVTDLYGDIYVLGHGMDAQNIETSPNLPYENSRNSKPCVSRFSSDGMLKSVIILPGVRFFDFAVGQEGNTYFTGMFDVPTAFYQDFEGSIDFNTVGPNDVFLTSYDTNGEYRWTKTWGGDRTPGSRGTAITVDDSGRIYLAGFFTGVCDFDPGEGTEIRESLRHSNRRLSFGEDTSGHYSDSFLSCFDSDGNFNWVQTWGVTDSSEIVNSIALDNFGNVWLTGHMLHFGGSNPQISPPSFNPPGNWHGILILAFTPDGVPFTCFPWGRRVTVDSMSGNDIAIGVDGSIWVTGGATGNMDFGENIGPFSCDYQQSNVFLMKIVPAR